jgi:hypothetical protein
MNDTKTKTNKNKTNKVKNNKIDTKTAKTAKTAKTSKTAKTAKTITKKSRVDNKSNKSNKSIKDESGCLSDCNVITLILKYLVAIFQYLSIEITDYNMKLKTTKCLNTAVMLVYILSEKIYIKQNVDYCDTDNINKRFNTIREQNLDTMEEKKKILDDLDKDIKIPETNTRFFYYVLMTHTKMKKKKRKSKLDMSKDYEWFPGHVYIIEKHTDCKDKLKYKIYQSYINEYDLNGHYKYNNNSVNLRSNIKTLVNGMKNILVKKKWNKSAVNFWNKLCYIDTSNLVGCETEYINICYTKIPIKNCYKNLERFTNNAIKNIQKNISNGNNDIYNINQDDNHMKIRQYEINELLNEFKNLKLDLENI